MELVKDVGGRPQKSLSEQQVQEVKTLGRRTLKAAASRLFRYVREHAQ